MQVDAKILPVRPIPSRKLTSLISDSYLTLPDQKMMYWWCIGNNWAINISYYISKISKFSYSFLQIDFIFTAKNDIKFWGTFSAVKMKSICKNELLNLEFFEQLKLTSL